MGITRGGEGRQRGAPPRPPHGGMPIDVLWEFGGVPEKYLDTRSRRGHPARSGDLENSQATARCSTRGRGVDRIAQPFDDHVDGGIVYDEWRRE
jgi:hypothetical protein